VRAHRSADAVRMLIAPRHVNAKEPAENQTALMWAAAEHHPDVARALIDAKADLRAHTRKGFTALHFAAREGDLEITRLLLASGVNVNIRSEPEPSDGEPGKEASGVRPASGRSAGAGARGPAYQPRCRALLVATVGPRAARALLIDQRRSNVGDAGFTPLHWAAGTWEGGVESGMGSPIQ
jgi:ankyrin repeat protein